MGHGQLALQVRHQVQWLAALLARFTDGTSAKQMLSSARRCDTRTDVIKIRVIVLGRVYQKGGTRERTTRPSKTSTTRSLSLIIHYKGGVCFCVVLRLTGGSDIDRAESQVSVWGLRSAMNRTGTTRHLRMSSSPVG